MVWWSNNYAVLSHLWKRRNLHAVLWVSNWSIMSSGYSDPKTIFLHDYFRKNQDLNNQYICCNKITACMLASGLDHAWLILSNNQYLLIDTYFLALAHLTNLTSSWDERQCPQNFCNYFWNLIGAEMARWVGPCRHSFLPLRWPNNQMTYGTVWPLNLSNNHVLHHCFEAGFM